MSHHHDVCDICLRVLCRCNDTPVQPQPTPGALTREQVELRCKNVRDIGHLDWECNELLDHDAALRQALAKHAQAIDALRAECRRIECINAQQAQELERMTDKYNGLADYMAADTTRIITATKRAVELAGGGTSLENAIERMAQEVERVKAALGRMEADRDDARTERNTAVIGNNILRDKLAAMTAERDKAVKWRGHHDAQVELKRKLHEMNNALRKELAASQQRVRELEEVVRQKAQEFIKPILVEGMIRCTVKGEVLELCEVAEIGTRHQLVTLQATLAEREQDIKNMEHEAMQEGEQFRQFAQEIITPNMRVATEGPISFGKLKEVVEAAIAQPVQEAGRLREAVEAVCHSYGDKGWAKTEMVIRLQRALKGGE